MNTNIMQYIQTESFESMIKLLGLGIAENLIRGGGTTPLCDILPLERKNSDFFLHIFYLNKGYNFPRWSIGCRVVG